ncbi:UNKNOWN [Stylonychia lemnae]|uniref:Uncharacterized protein n=1 Tax=Stylonychia lemnae TaxID=5949 RepID=A0A078BDH7_STYLE|nr:UNKNOWN [Stylonychia lemnae]|eukprot:CDW91643.1 UNKNOWN [Stylonychia lemnae]
MQKVVILSLLSLIAVKTALVEVSNQHLIQRLSAEGDALNKIINLKWHELNHQDDVKLDLESLKTSNPQNSERKAIDFTFQGQVSSHHFSATIHTKLESSPPYDNYRNLPVSSVEITGVADGQLKQDLEQSIGRFADALTGWTHFQLWETSAEFYVLHLATQFGLRLCNAFYTNGQSVFLEQSGASLRNFTTRLEQVNQYSKLPSSDPRYFSITLNDKFLLDFFEAFLGPEKQINVATFLSNFNTLKQYVEMMKVDKLLMLFPTLADRYNKNDSISIMISPEDTLQEGVDYAKKNIKIVFKKDSADILLPIVFNLIVNQSDSWDIFRKGYVGLGLGSTLKQLEDKPLKFSMKANAGIKKIVLIDNKAEDEEDQNMEHEAGAILGLVNLFLKKQFKAQTVEAPLHLLEKFNSFVDIEKIASLTKIKLIPGYLDASIGDLELKDLTIPTKLIERVKFEAEGVSDTFHKDQLRKKAAYERKQQKLAKKQETTEKVLENDQIKIEL